MKPTRLVRPTKTAYLDNAATTFPKPPSVLRAVTESLRDFGGNAGRGSHRLARRAAEVLYRTREEVAAFVGLSDPTRVVFTPNTTYALNLALKGFLNAGDHVLISDLEHNSVLRPIVALGESRGVTYSVFPTEHLTSTLSVELTLAPLLQTNTRAVVSTHASNLCSRTLPIRAIGDFCRRHGLLFLVDAAQSVGHLPIDLARDGITALAAPGHKGLYGPQGSGFLALSASLSEDELPRPLVEGGSGYQSLLPEMPALPPERYEAGTVALPSVAGLSAGIGFVREVGIDGIREHEASLFRLARERLGNLDGVTLYAPESVGSVLSFSLAGHPSEEVADALDREGICVRAGFHCTALAHRTLRTPAESGAVRLGFGYYNTPEEVRRVADAVRRL